MSLEAVNDLCCRFPPSGGDSGGTWPQPARDRQQNLTATRFPRPRPAFFKAMERSCSIQPMLQRDASQQVRREKGPSLHGGGAEHEGRQPPRSSGDVRGWGSFVITWDDVGPKARRTRMSAGASRQKAKGKRWEGAWAGRKDVRWGVPARARQQARLTYAGDSNANRAAFRRSGSCCVRGCARGTGHRRRRRSSAGRRNLLSDD